MNNSIIVIIVISVLLIIGVVVFIVIKKTKEKFDDGCVDEGNQSYCNAVNTHGLCGNPIPRAACKRTCGVCDDGSSTQTSTQTTTNNYREIPGSYCIPSSIHADSNINSYVVGNLEDGKRACEANDDCKGFTLKNAPNEQMKYILKSEITGSNIGDRNEQFGCYNNIGRNPFPDRSHDNCQWWDGNGDNNLAGYYKCTLGGTPDGAFIPSTVGIDSTCNDDGGGWVRCDQEWEDAEDCSVNLAYYNGTMINDNANANSAVACRGQCQNNDECNFWDWSKGGYGLTGDDAREFRCRLRGDDGGRPLLHAPAIAGSKNCLMPGDQRPRCVEGSSWSTGSWWNPTLSDESLGRYGNPENQFAHDDALDLDRGWNIRQDGGHLELPGQTIGDCRDRCIKDEECHFWDFNSYRNPYSGMASSTGCRHRSEEGGGVESGGARPGRAPPDRALGRKWCVLPSLSTGMDLYHQDMTMSSECQWWDGNGDDNLAGYYKCTDSDGNNIISPIGQSSTCVDQGGGWVLC